MDTIRETYLARLTQDFKAMANLVLRQAQILKLQLAGDTTQALKDEMQKNEHSIDDMEIKLRDDIINSIVLFSRAETSGASFHITISNRLNALPIPWTVSAGGCNT